MQLLELLVVLIGCHAAPILVARLLKNRYAWPIDGGRRAPDGQPWLGSSKTWRGLVVSLVFGILLGVWLGWGAAAGAVFAGLAMLGDLVSSYSKRRLKMESSAKATFLDQVPESLLPLGYATLGLDYAFTDALLALLGFFVFETQVSPLLFRLGIRARPH